MNFSRRSQTDLIRGDFKMYRFNDLTEPALPGAPLSCSLKSLSDNPQQTRSKLDIYSTALHWEPFHVSVQNSYSKELSNLQRTEKVQMGLKEDE